MLQNLLAKYIVKCANNSLICNTSICNRLQGFAIRNYSNGNLAYLNEYKNDLQDGISFCFNYAGQILYIYRYLNDKKHGRAYKLNSIYRYIDFLIGTRSHVFNMFA